MLVCNNPSIHLREKDKGWAVGFPQQEKLTTRQGTKRTKVLLSKQYIDFCLGVFPVILIYSLSHFITLLV